MKTRHGKILTTTGELLHLPEEDFQKIRTNRKRKDCVLETTTNADNVASNLIVNFSNQHDGAQIVEEYVLKENVDDINRNWETKGTIQVVDKCIGSFEICTESQWNKTDGIETEIAVDCRYSKKDDSNIKMDYINDVQNDLLQLKNPFYDNLETANNEENHVAYQHNYKDGEKVYDCSEVIQSYTEVSCNNEALRRNEDTSITQHEVNMESPKEQNNYHKVIYDNGTRERSTAYMHLEIDNVEVTSSDENNQINNERYNTQVIIAQNDAVNEESGKYANSLDIETKEYIKNEIYLQPTSTNVSILQTYDKMVEEIVPLNQNMILQQDEHVSESKFVATKTLNIEELNVSSNDTVATKEETAKQENKQYLYLRTGTLDGIISQNKCINIPLHQINLYCDQHNLKGNADNCKQIKVLNGDIRAINLKQSDKQNAILLVSNDSLQNGVIQIDKGNITVKGINR